MSADLRIHVLFIREPPRKLQLVVTALWIALAIVITGRQWIGSRGAGLSSGSLYRIRRAVGSCVSLDS
jgi:hypothetical protein